MLHSETLAELREAQQTQRTHLDVCVAEQILSEGPAVPGYSSVTLHTL